MKKFIVLFCASLCLGSPLPQQIEGFGDATPEEIAEIRAGTYGEMFDENPQYSFDFKVADNVEQTYIAQQESRDVDIVTGSYSYVDPLGSLITVNYEAGPMGYTETRNVQENFIEITPKPASSFSNSGSSSVSSSSNSGSNSFSSGSSSISSSNFGSNTFSSGSSSLSSDQQLSSFSQDDLISSVVSQIQPLVSGAVNSAISSSSSSSNIGSNSISSSSLSSRPVTTTTITSTLPSSTSAISNQDLVSSVVSQIQPLVSGAVSSAIGASQNGRTVARVRVPVSAVRAPAPAVRVPAPAVRVPAPVVRVPAPAVRVVAPAPRSGNIGDFFGDGNFNVRINTPDFNIEY